MLKTNLTSSTGFMPLLMAQPFISRPVFLQRLLCPHLFPLTLSSLLPRGVITPACLSHLHYWLPSSSSYTSHSFISSLHNIRDLFFPPTVSSFFDLPQFPTCTDNTCNHFSSFSLLFRFSTTRLDGRR